MRKFILSLLLLLLTVFQFLPAFSSVGVSHKKAIACEAKILKYHKYSVILDQTKEKTPEDFQKIYTLERALDVLEKYTNRFCSEYHSIS